MALRSLERERLIECCEPVERHHGPENLLAGEEGIVFDIFKHCGRDQVSAITDLPAADEHGAAFGLPALDGLDDVGELRFADDRADLGVRVAGVADGSLLDPRQERGAKEVVGLFFDVDAPRGGAFLAG